MDETVFDRIAHHRFVPVVEVDDVARGVQLARTLVDSGLPIAEVALRTPAALDAIRAIATEVPELLIGAGTLVSAEQVAAAADAGARFGLSPGFTPALSDAARESSLPWIPGTVSPSEILAAMAHGHRHLKFFPAEAFGGPATIAALLSSFGPAGAVFMPTGGVRPTNLAKYLAIPQVFAAGGTWVATRAQIRAGNFSQIAEAAQDTVRLIAALDVGASK